MGVNFKNERGSKNRPDSLHLNIQSLNKETIEKQKQSNEMIDDDMGLPFLGR